MSWVSQFIKHNRHIIGSVGNALKDVSPLLAFTPLGIPAAALAAAAGEGMRPGANLGSIVKSGAENAAIGGGAKAASGALRAAFAPSSSLGTGMAGGTLPGAATNTITSGGASLAPSSGFSAINGAGVHAATMPMMTAAQRAAAEAAANQGGSLLSTLGHAARGAGHFAHDNPTLVSGALSAFGPGASYDRARAQREEYELQAERARDAALEPLRRALMGQLGQIQYSHGSVAPNPYFAGGVP